MLTLGLGLLAFSMIALWLCLPDRLGAKQRFLRGGLDTLASIVIVSSFGIGIVVLAVGMTQGSSKPVSIAGSSSSASTSPVPR